MHVTLVRVLVESACRDEFIEATRVNHEASIREAGNRRFDVLEDARDQGTFLLYEWYDSAEDASAHRQTEHFLAWRDAVEHMMVKPRELEVFDGLYPRW